MTDNLKGYMSQTYRASNGVSITFDSLGETTVSVGLAGESVRLPTEDLFIIVGAALGLRHEELRFLRDLEGGEWDRLEPSTYKEYAAKLQAITDRIAALLPMT